ncbi:MAG: hypothetical protein AB7T49_03165 [Oligoflexales bacterium]
MRLMSLFVLGLVLARCSSGSNFNQIFVAQGQKDSFDYLMEKAQMSYDQGEFNDALGFANKAYKINPKSESTSVLLGYIYLSIAGIDTFQLATNLMESNEEKTSLAEEKKDAPDALTKLAGIIGVSEDDIAKLTKDELDGVSGTSEIAIFDGMDVVFPISAVEAREGDVPALAQLARSIEMVCPWVNDDVKVTVENDKSTDDPRHVDTYCEATTTSRYLSSKAHYLWSLSHLSEAIVFNTVISNNMPNLLKRAEAMSSKDDLDDPGEYIAAVVDLANVTNALLPTDAEAAAESMLTGLFNDLEAVTMGFAALPGMPAKMTKPVSDALEKLKAQAEKIQESGNANTDPNAGALRDQLTKKFAAKVKEQLEEREDEFTEDQKKDACEAYGKISSQELDICADLDP